jgi:CelD/BcsL family acetyltransferase involved in cellulose biosynthesis
VQVIAGRLSPQRSKNAPAHTDGTDRCAATRAQGLECEFIGSRLRLEELQEDWRELWSSLPDATPFQSPEWLVPWWNHYGEGDLFCFAFWDRVKLVGFAPLHIFKSPTDSVRMLFLLGTGNSDYLDVLFDPAWRSQCWNALISEIENRSEQWDACSMQRLRPGSPLLDDIADDPRFELQVNPQVPCVAIDLHNPCHGEVLLRRSQSYARKLQRVHSYMFEEVTAETLQEFSEALERLHQQRWREERCRGALSSPVDRNFHREVARRFLNAGMLMFYGIRMAGKLIAVIYGFRVCNRVYSYLSGFDTEYARNSVGAISIGAAVERAMKCGCEVFDFLQGQEPYKYTWGAQDVPCFARTILKA